MFRFATPHYLLLLGAIPLLLIYRRRKPMRPTMGASSLTSVEQIAVSPALRFKWLLPTLKIASLALIIVALARPQWGTRQVKILTEGINIILAVDLSESMAALDFKQDGKVVNRLEAVKGVVRQFISQRDGDRIGLVVFGDHAYTQLPLTRDYPTISSVLDRLEIGAAGRQTAIGDAIGISLKRLGDVQSHSNIVILLTDGQSNSGELSPDDAAGIAAEKKVKVYTIGVGTRGKAPYLIKHPVFGPRYVYQQVDIDEATLRSIARRTDAAYFRAEDAEGLAKIYGTIDQLEKTKVRVKTYAEYREYYRYLLVPAFLMLGFWVLLTNTRLLQIP